MRWTDVETKAVPNLLGSDSGRERTAVDMAPQPTVTQEVGEVLRLLTWGPLAATYTPGGRRAREDSWQAGLKGMHMPKA